jgi:hypothetical protein
MDLYFSCSLTGGRKMLTGIRRPDFTFQTYGTTEEARAHMDGFLAR